MSLANLLTRQLQHLDTLIELLGDEQNALVAGEVDGDRLTEVARRKQTELRAIETLENGRRSVQAKLGYADGTAGAEAAARDAGCIATWQQVHDAARRVAHLNQLNGTLVEQRMQHNQQVLTLLRELARDALYGQDGHQNRSGGHINSSA